MRLLKSVFNGRRAIGLLARVDKRLGKPKGGSFMVPVQLGLDSVFAGGAALLIVNGDDDIILSGNLGNELRIRN